MYKLRAVNWVPREIKFCYSCLIICIFYYALTTKYSAFNEFRLRTTIKSHTQKLSTITTNSNASSISFLYDNSPFNVSNFKGGRNQLVRRVAMKPSKVTQFKNKMIPVKNAETINLLTKMARLSQEAYCLNEKQKVSVDFYADINVERVDEKKIDILLKFRCGKILTYEEWLVRRTRVIGFPEIANNRLDMEFWNKGSVGAKILLRKLKEVLKQYPHEILTFYFTGHDVGGVWAVLTAFLLIRGILPTLPRERLIVTTFGQPRFLNGLFCRYMKSIMTIYRVTLKDDYVPSFPVVTRDAFNHFPEEYWISNETCDCTSEPAIVYHCLSDKIPHKWRHEQGEIIFEEHPFCNAQFHGQTPERNVHNGPYFGYTFGSCPQKEQ